jgi:hypothetical protein
VIIVTTLTGKSVRVTGLKMQRIVSDSTATPTEQSDLENEGRKLLQSVGM